jgi:hypothetical protein
MSALKDSNKKFKIKAFGDTFESTIKESEKLLRKKKRIAL